METAELALAGLVSEVPAARNEEHSQVGQCVTSLLPLPACLSFLPLCSPLVGSVKSGLSIALKMYPNLGERRKRWESAGRSKSPTSSSMGSLSAPPSVLCQGRDCRGSQPGSWEGLSTRMGEGREVLDGGLGTGTGGCCLGGPSSRLSGCWLSSPHPRQACRIMG